MIGRAIPAISRALCGFDPASENFATAAGAPACQRNERECKTALSIIVLPLIAQSQTAAWQLPHTAPEAVAYLINVLHKTLCQQVAILLRDAVVAIHYFVPLMFQLFQACCNSSEKIDGLKASHDDRNFPSAA